MKKTNLLYIFNIVLISTFLSSCSVIGDIFQAGMGFGIFIVVAIIVLILYFVMRSTKK